MDETADLISHVLEDCSRQIARSNRVTLDDVFLGNRRHCSRMVVSSDQVNASYEYELTSGTELRIVRRVLARDDYLRPAARDTLTVEKLPEILAERIPSECALFELDPAPHGDHPIYHLARELWSGSRLYVFHAMGLDPSIPSAVTGAPVSVASGVVQAELGLDLDRTPYMQGALALICPYETGAISHWRVFRDSQQRECLRVFLRFARWLSPFPDFSLRIGLRNKSGDEFFSTERKIAGEDALVQEFVPDTPEPIYRVRVELFEDGQLVDDDSGYPVREIRVTLRPTTTGKQ